MATLIIEGLDELQADLAAAGQNVDEDLGRAIDDGLRVVATRAESKAPKRSGRMAGSITPLREGLAGEIRVTARRRSRGYPGGYPYPAKVERLRPFLAPAAAQEAPRVVQRMEECLDDIARRLGG